MQWQHWRLKPSLLFNDLQTSFVSVLTYKAGRPSTSSTTADRHLGWKPVVLPVSPPRPHLSKALPLIRAFMWAFLNWGSDFLPSAFIFIASRTHYVYLGILGPCSHVVTSSGFRDPIAKNHMKWPTWEQPACGLRSDHKKTPRGRRFRHFWSPTCEQKRGLCPH